MDGLLERYVQVLEHERHIENRTFTALGNYLTANAFIFAAWATFYMKDPHPDFERIDWVLGLLSVLGYFGGVAWALLGTRNWDYARRLVAELVRIGDGLESTGPRSNLYQIIRAVEEDVHARWGHRYSFSSHPSLLARTPLAVALVYLVMLNVLLLSRSPALYSALYWFWPTVVSAIAVLVLIAVHRWCCDCARAAEDQVRRAKESARDID
jgi:hypothetical protein